MSWALAGRLAGGLLSLMFVLAAIVLAVTWYDGQPATWQVWVLAIFANLQLAASTAAWVARG